MEAKETYLKDCFVLKPNVFNDDRGYFLEDFNKKAFQSVTGLEIEFVQDNQSYSAKGVLRGLHYQKGDRAQAKLVRVIKGEVLDVCVDLRKGSKTFGKHFSILLDDKEHKQLFIPRGFAHGFVVLSKHAIFSYKCDNYYNKESEGGIIFSDPTLAIDWKLPQDNLILSQKDLELPTLQNAEL